VTRPALPGLLLLAIAQPAQLVGLGNVLRETLREDPHLVGFKQIDPGTPVEIESATAG
jgi:hypothetical protein